MSLIGGVGWVKTLIVTMQCHSFYSFFLSLPKFKFIIKFPRSPVHSPETPISLTQKFAGNCPKCPSLGTWQFFAYAIKCGATGSLKTDGYLY